MLPFVKEIMSTTMQNLVTTSHRARYWAPVTGFLLAAAFLASVQLQPPAHFAPPTRFFESGEIEAVSFVGNRTHTAAPEPALPRNIVEQAAPLFGMDTEPLTEGEVLKQWSRMKAEIARELQIVDRCRADNACPAGAQRLIDLSLEGAGRNGRARVGLINRAVDLAIRPTSDEAQWRVPDHWSTPFETLRSGRGDCEDYAIVKYVALLEAGISADDVKIVLVRNVFPNEDHAVVATRVDGKWLILDNRTLTLVRDTDLTRAVPALVLDQAGVQRFVSKGRTRSVS
jgi:predicted transglutaminase-like cysteine proteinase